MGIFKKKYGSKDFAGEIFKAAFSSLTRINKYYEEDEENDVFLLEEKRAVLLEMLYVLMHLTQRACTDVTDNIIMDDIRTEIMFLSILTAIHFIHGSEDENKVRKYGLIYSNEFNDRISYYSHLRTDSSVETGMKDQLLWEMAKNIACAAGKKMDAAFIVFTLGNILEAIKELDPATKFNRILKESKKS